MEVYIQMMMARPIESPRKRTVESYILISRALNILRNISLSRAHDRARINVAIIFYFVLPTQRLGKNREIIIHISLARLEDNEIFQNSSIACLRKLLASPR